MRKATDQIRAHIAQDGTVTEDMAGRLFFDESTAKFTDLSKVKFLNCGIDTVRQLYKGIPRPEVLEIFEGKPGVVDFAGYRFHSSRIGRDSGYQFKLQNADLGLILLIKNFNCKPDAHGSHLKIEVSPHAIDQQTPERLQERLDHLAAHVLDRMERNQAAVHIALDFQGWQPPADFVARLHCRAQAQRRLDGVLTYESAEHSAVYNRGQSFLFGSAGAVQFALYNKTLQAKSVDKLDYWQSVWRRRDSLDPQDHGNYDPDAPVWRLELRFHHSVVQQFAEGSASVHTGETLGTTSYAELVPHLQGLWRYGLENFRFLSRPGVYDAFWTLCRDDVKVQTAVDDLLAHTEYKRYYKTATGFNGKVIDNMLGGLVSLLARGQVGAKKGFLALKDLPVWPIIRDHFAERDMSERDIYRQIKERLEERTVRWGMAV